MEPARGMGAETGGKWGGRWKCFRGESQAVRSVGQCVA